MREGVSPSPSPLLHRAMPNIRAVTKNGDAVDGPTNIRTSTPPTSPQLGKLIIRAARSPDRAASPDYVRTPATVVGPTSPTSHHRQVRGAYVNVQDDEGKTTSGTDEHRDCTSRASRLEARASAIASSRSKDESRQPLGNSNPASCNNNTKLPEPNPASAKDKIGNCHAGAQVDTKQRLDRDEHHSPELNGDAPEANVSRVTPSKFDHPVGPSRANLRLDFENSDLYPKSLRPTGNTPKLGKKLLISDLDTPNFCRKKPDSQNTVEENRESITCDNSSDKNASVDCAESDARAAKKFSAPVRSDRTDRKVKRSESYRMANSPIMFIKKFSASQTEKSKISRTPSEELQEELLKERINYPETVSSPEPRLVNSAAFDMKSTNVPSVPISPRPRATDLEPVRVLKYSSTDTEIW